MQDENEKFVTYENEFLAEYQETIRLVIKRRQSNLRVIVTHSPWRARCNFILSKKSTLAQEEPITLLVRGIILHKNN